MKLKPVKLAPALIAVCVIVFVCVLRLVQPDFLERPELMTYDMRVRQALRFNPPVATNLGFVEISDHTIEEIRKGLLKTSFGLYWPRQVYGRLVRELAAQRAKGVGLDIIFAERRIDHAPVRLSLSQWPDAGDFISALQGEDPVTYEDQGEKWMLMDSDDYFAWQLRRANNVILAADRGVEPDRLFATNTLAVADISAKRDPDGVLRRVKAFQMYTNWHRVFQEAENDPALGVNLQKARVEGTNIVLYRPERLDPIKVPIDADNNFELSAFLDPLPPGWPAKDKAFTVKRIWHMGIVLAAQELNLDLANAEVTGHGRIVLRGANGVQRILAVDKDGYFYVNWELPYSDPRVARERMENLLLEDMARSEGVAGDLVDRWKNMLVIVGSTTVGNDLTDRGATPLEQDTLLASKHWNVANSILQDRFVRRSSLATDLLLIVVLGITSALLTWQLRVLRASAMVALLVVGYIGLGMILYVQQRYWLPLVLPISGALLLTHVCLVTWRVVFEQAEQRRVKSIFSRVVSPNIVNVLLGAERLSLGGARREVTVLFADVRGFTEFTDISQDRALAYIAEKKLSSEAAEAHINEQARETLNTVNSYLALVADMVKKHDGTLDKYIGDCVMAFWGAPTPNLNHARDCVRAALEAQRAINELNHERADENRRREAENPARLSAGLSPRPMQPILLLGSGINTGMATVGLMGSEAHISNYTVFGREVNLASRLEGLSGRGRIFISEATYEKLRQEDPALAATCTLQPLTRVKGFGAAVKVYEVPWLPPGVTRPDQQSASSLEAATTSDTALAAPEKPGAA